MHTFDLTGTGMGTVQFFPDAVAAFAIPDTLEERLSLLVWGVVVPRPQDDLILCERLPPAILSDLPTALYLSGWGVLTFEGVRGGEISVHPYLPTISLKDLRFPTNSVEPPCITRAWTATTTDGIRYHISVVLEQPLAFASLKIAAVGAVTLRVDAHDFVTEEQLEAFPPRYRFDLTRTRQLAAIPCCDRQPQGAVVVTRSVSPCEVATQ